MIARMIIGSVAAGTMSASVYAADLPSRSAPPPAYVPPAPILTWTGFYVGLNAGYGAGVSSNATTVSRPLFDGIALAADTLDPPRQLVGTGLVSGITALANSGVADLRQNGFIGGGQIGYNFQLGPSFLVGGEADFQGATIRGTGSYAGLSQDSIAWKD